MNLAKFRRVLLNMVLAFLALLILALVSRAIYLQPKVDFEPLIPEEALDHSLHVDIFPGSQGKRRFSVAEKAGLVKWFYEDSQKADGILLDIRDKVLIEHWEDGLLAMAIAPDFEQSRHVYVYYTSAPANTNILSRFYINNDFKADPESETVFLQFKKNPAGHNGGAIQFDKNGYLYLSLGDSGTGHRVVTEEQLRKAQTLFGSILRLDVSKASASLPYSIPPDNPYANSNDGKRAEIWAHGFRNPWRFTIDDKTGELFAGDVGDNDWEEINYVEKGKYYGWPDTEASDCSPPHEPQDCDKSTTSLPIAAFSHDHLRAIVGGYIYTGDEIAWLKGKYVFSGFMRGIFAIDLPAKGADIIREPIVLSYKAAVLQGPNKGEAMHLVSFKRDAEGELYMADLRGGVYRLRAMTLQTRIESFFHHLLRF